MKNHPLKTLVGVLLVTISLLSIAGAAPLYYWTFEGTPGTPGSSGTWWQDKLGSNNMSVALSGTPAQQALPLTGPGSDFPDPIPNPGTVSGTNLYGFDTSAGALRSATGTWYNYNTFTIEGFFNLNSVGVTESTLVQIRNSAGTLFSGVARPDGFFGGYVYSPTGVFTTGSTQTTPWTLTAGKDYYFAYVVSYSSVAANRYLDFYLQNLTDGGSLLYQRNSLLGTFTSAFTASDHQLRLGVTTGNIDIMSDVRFSSGALAESELLIPEPSSVLMSALGLGMLAATSRRRHQRLR